MPSFDITSEFNQQEVTNAIDQMNREIINRYDFKDTNIKRKIEKNSLMTNKFDCGPFGSIASSLNQEDKYLELLGLEFYRTRNINFYLMK